MLLLLNPCDLLPTLTLSLPPQNLPLGSHCLQDKVQPLTHGHVANIAWPFGILQPPLPPSFPKAPALSGLSASPHTGLPAWSAPLSPGLGSLRLALQVPTG